MMTGVNTISHASAVPFYVQLKYRLRTLARTLPSHSPLPSEKELEGQFGVSRTVVRQALLDLVHEGLIYRRKGSGSFVAPPKLLEGQIQRLTSFSYEMARLGHAPTTTVLRQEVMGAEAPTTDLLEIEPDHPVVVLKRVRSVERQPLMLSTTWLPFDLCAGLEREDFTKQSLYETLRTNFLRTIVRSSRTLEAVAASREEADLLETPSGSNRRRGIVYLGPQPLEGPFPGAARLAHALNRRPVPPVTTEFERSWSGSRDLNPNLLPGKDGALLSTFDPDPAKLMHGKAAQIPCSLHPSGCWHWLDYRRHQLAGRMVC